MYYRLFCLKFEQKYPFVVSSEGLSIRHHTRSYVSPHFNTKSFCCRANHLIIQLRGLNS